MAISDHTAGVLYADKALKAVQVRRVGLIGGGRERERNGGLLINLCSSPFFISVTLTSHLIPDLCPSLSLAGTGEERQHTERGGERGKEGGREGNGS